MNNPIISFESGNNLYHYTSLKSFVKILESGKLKFNALPKMNDITEASKDCYIEANETQSIDWENLSLLANRLKNIGQISLVQDDKFPGYALHSMWGHYAEAGEGCCLVLEKTSVIREAKIAGMFCDRVTYDDAIADVIIPSGIDVDEYVNTDCKKLFFHKRKEWEHEQEYRIINLNFEPAIFCGLSIKDSLIAVIFHTNCRHSIFDCIHKQPYLDKLGNIPALEYRVSGIFGNKNGDAILDKDRMNLLDVTTKYKVKL